MENKSRLTINDIARLLNLSKSTVSRAIRDSWDVSPETKSRVLELAREIDVVCRRSLSWGLSHLDEAMAFAGQFGRGCAKPFVEMFSNQDTFSLPDDAVRALRILFDRTAALGLGPRIDGYEVIRG
jgi:predicted solute-binding protein